MPHVEGLGQLCVPALKRIMLIAVAAKPSHTNRSAKQRSWTSNEGLLTHVSHAPYAPRASRELLCRDPLRTSALPTVAALLTQKSSLKGAWCGYASAAGGMSHVCVATRLKSKSVRCQTNLRLLLTAPPRSAIRGLRNSRVDCSRAPP